MKFPTKAYWWTLAIVINTGSFVASLSNPTWMMLVNVIGAVASTMSLYFVMEPYLAYRKEQQHQRKLQADAQLALQQHQEELDNFDFKKIGLKKSAK